MYGLLPFGEIADPLESQRPEYWTHLALAYTPCLGLYGNTHFDLSPKRFHGTTVGVVSRPTYVDSPIGPALAVTATADGVAYAASALNPMKLGDSLLFAVEAFFRNKSGGTAGDHLILRSDMPGTFDSTYYGYVLSVDGSSGVLSFIVYDGTGTPITLPRTTYNPTSALTQDQWHHVFVLYANQPAAWGQYAAFVIDGLFDLGTVTNVSTPGGNEITPVHSSAKAGRLLGRSTGQSATDPRIDLALVRIWNVPLALVDIGAGVSTLLGRADDLRADPLAMFRRRRRIVGKSPAAASALPQYVLDRRRRIA